MHLAAVQDLLHRNVIQDSNQASNVILVRMRGHQEIQAGDALVSQVGFDSRSGVLCAAVDEQVLAVELNQFRVTLAHVDEVDGEILACGYCRDGNQQDCENGYLQEPLKIGIFHFVPSGMPYIDLRI